MKYLDLENWPRKNHFQYFNRLDYPQFNLCANVDVTRFFHFLKAQDIPFFKGFLYIATRAANENKAFRYRIRDNRVVEHDVVHPSFTIMTSKNVFSFCEVKFQPRFTEFIEKATRNIEARKHTVYVEDEPGRDDLLYITSIPWVSFTSITHPIHMHPVDSIPRISWGKYFEENHQLKLPLSVQVHHALVDGFHVGEYFIRVQKLLDEPELFG